MLSNILTEVVSNGWIKRNVPRTPKTFFLNDKLKSTVLMKNYIAFMTWSR